MNSLLQIMLTGIIMGNTICMFSSCSISPIMYLSAVNPGVKRTLKLVLLFSFSRLVTYAVLGAVAEESGIVLYKLIGSAAFETAMGLITGAINIIIGFFIVIGQEPFHFSRLCRYSVDLLKKGYSIVLLGIFLAIVPCAPLTSFFTQVMVRQGGILAGAAEGAVFGVGITLSVPFWLLALFSGSVPNRLLKNKRLAEAFRIICGCILILIGLRYALDAVF